jgi:ATP-dependent DNA ligase
MLREKVVKDILKNFSRVGPRSFCFLEGMVMKRKDSVYAFMLHRDWLKVRASGRNEDDAEPN